MFHKKFTMGLIGLVLMCSASLLVNCTSRSKQVGVDLANTDIAALIAENEKKVARAYEEQWDILAYRELDKSARHLSNAKKYYSEGMSLGRVANEIGEFDTYYKQAQNLAELRIPRFEGLLAARRRVLDSGVRKIPEESKKLYKLDQDFRELTDNRRVEVKAYSDLQNEYIKLSIITDKNKNLSLAKQQVQYAINNKARRYAPKALNIAELNIKNAENMLDVHLDNPSGYEAHVKNAKLSAAMLAAIVDEQRKANYNLDEATAKKIVVQRGLVEKMNEDLQSKDQELILTEQQVQRKEAELVEAEKEKRFQAALASAQKQFFKSEADVYRQGDKILIRLKKMEFPSGQATVPEKSKQLLDKVAVVAKQLDPQEIIVEGHTDSVGSATVNSKISQERADSVLGYFEGQGIPNSILQSVGYGYEKPLGSNKTKIGRAQNRRVDIWITPAPNLKVTE